MINRLKQDVRKRSAYYWRMLAAYLLLLLVPVLFMESVNFLSVRSSTLASMNELFLNDGNRRLETLEEQITAAGKVAANARHTSCFYEPFSKKNYPSSVLDIEEYLNKQSPWLTLFSEIYYYHIGKETAIFADGLKSKETLYNNYHRFTGNYWGNGEDNQGMMFAEYRNDTSGREQIALIIPLEQKIAKEREFVSCLVLVLDKSRLGELLAMPGNYPEEAISLYYQNQLIYSNGGERVKAGTKALEPTVSGAFFTLKWRIPETVYTNTIMESIRKQFMVVFTVLAVGLLMIYKFMEYNYIPLKNIVERLAEKLPHQTDQPIPTDEFRYLDLMLGELLYSKQLLEESNLTLKREQLLYQLLYSHIQKGSLLYSECIGCGIRVDLKSLECLYLEEQGGDSKWYVFLTEELGAKRDGLYIYSVYYTEAGFIFLITSTMKPEELDAFLRAEICPENGTRVVFGKAVESSEQINDSYKSLQTDQPDSHYEMDRKRQSGGAEQKFTFSPADRFYPHTSLTALFEAAEEESLEKMGLVLSNIREAIAIAPPAAAVVIYLEAARILSEEEIQPSGVLELLGGSDSEEARGILSKRLDILYKQFRTRSVLTSSASGQLKKGEQPIRWDRDLNRIIRYIEENHMKSTFSIKSMAADIGTTQSNLSHYFKKSTGQNISKYIDTVRMKRAMELLKGPARIADIAESLGYNSSAVFIETFKRTYGMPPNQYRQQHGTARRT